jgi:hypothetical protein
MINEKSKEQNKLTDFGYKQIDSIQKNNCIRRQKLSVSKYWFEKQSVVKDKTRMKKSEI